MYRFLVVRDKAQAREAYPMLEKACARITQREDRALFAPDVYSALMHGSARMTMILDGEEPVGLFVTTDGVATNGDVSCHVWVAYAVPGAPTAVLPDGLQEVERQAQEQRRGQITFGTRRPGWLRLAQHLGYTMTEWRFEKQVNL